MCTKEVNPVFIISRVVRRSPEASDTTIELQEQDSILLKGENHCYSLIVEGSVKQVAPSSVAGDTHNTVLDEGKTMENTGDQLYNFVQGVNCDTTSNNPKSKEIMLFDINAAWDGKYLNVEYPKRFEKITHDCKQCRLFKEWQAKSHFDFGFIPLSHFVLPNNPNWVANGVECPIELY